jgi:hypothetical protein
MPWTVPNISACAGAEKKATTHMTKVKAIPRMSVNTLGFIISLARYEIQMTKYGLIRNPAEINYSVCFVPSAREAARRGSYWSGRSGRKKLRQRSNCGLYDCRTAERNRRYQNKERASHDRSRRSVTSPHRAIVVSRHANGVAIPLVLLDIIRLTMMHGAITCITAGWQIGGRKRPCQCRNAGQKQRDQGHKRCEFANGLRHFYSAPPD